MRKTVSPTKIATLLARASFTQVGRKVLAQCVFISCGSRQPLGTCELTAKRTISWIQSHEQCLGLDDVSSKPLDLIEAPVWQGISRSRYHLRVLELEKATCAKIKASCEMQLGISHTTFRVLVLFILFLYRHVSRLQNMHRNTQPLIEADQILGSKDVRIRGTRDPHAKA
jgi:hypothetical protein